LIVALEEIEQICLGAGFAITLVVQKKAVNVLMRILLFGSSGQVGWELQRSLAPLGKIICVGRRGVKGLKVDLTDLSGVARTLREVRPDVIVNAAAYTEVDRAQEEPELAFRINADAVGVMAEEGKALDALLVHYGTDYIFPGTGSDPWKETDNPSPLNIYGKSKLEGEAKILESGCRYIILRTSWVYSARGRNFLNTMLKIAREKDCIRVVNDQIGAPTSSELIADVTGRILSWRGSHPGIYHLAAEGEASWCDFARTILSNAEEMGAILKAKPESIIPVSSSEYLTPAVRPRNSRLNTDRIRTAFGVHLPHWSSGVRRVLAELIQNRSLPST
jgi:dTDP-4-dehydrorhamnose reductase